MIASAPPCWRLVPKSGEFHLFAVIHGVEFGNHSGRSSVGHPHRNLEGRAIRIALTQESRIGSGVVRARGKNINVAARERSSRGLQRKQSKFARRVFPSRPPRQ
ncbi:hypothetical protein HPP92_001162 [Vanilla planifolia]|uniref:Uncharacterized protein n=1 Tax=Vanilla planifolia TaxID=51239 RepID=A0A835S646_VANPL|nr:hypothetical protein HPP92_001162 [Vanilla planifolia]